MELKWKKNNEGPVVYDAVYGPDTLKTPWDESRRVGEFPPSQVSIIFCVYLTTALVIGNSACLPHHPSGDKVIFIGSLSVEKPYVFPPG